MSKAIWGVLGVLIIIVLGAYFLSQNKTVSQPNPTATETPTASTIPTESPKPEAMQENTITYTDTGFSPATLTIKVGDTVTWKNNSSKIMWVASNPHPTHTGLPGFDELKGVGSGESYSYTFTKTGTFGFHNHLSSGDGGSIIVE